MLHILSEILGAIGSLVALVVLYEVIDTLIHHA